MNTMIFHFLFQTMGTTYNKQNVDYDAAKIAAKTLRAINHKLRQRILKVINENQRINVTDLHARMRIEQSVASQHLAILRGAKIVKTERESRTIFYSLNISLIAEIEQLILYLS